MYVVLAWHVWETKGNYLISQEMEEDTSVMAFPWLGILVCSCNVCCALGCMGKPREPDTTLLVYGQGKKMNRIPLPFNCLSVAWNSGMLL